LRRRFADKHGLTMDEVEQVLFSRPHVRLAEKGRIKGEDLYAAYGQTHAGQVRVCPLHSETAGCGYAYYSSRHD
jgi:uncharacterized DUF497 family protein